MRIISVTEYRVRIPFKAVFVHALQSRQVTEAIVLVLESDAGHVGLGEVLARPYLTGETLESVSHTEIPALVQHWLGRAFNDREDVVEALRQELQLGQGFPFCRGRCVGAGYRARFGGGCRYRL